MALQNYKEALEKLDKACRKRIGLGEFTGKDIPKFEDARKDVRDSLSLLYVAMDNIIRARES